MPGRFRIFSREFKEAAVRRIPAGEKIRAVADDLKLHRQLLYTWLDYYQRGGPDALVPRGRPWKAVALARQQALGQAPRRPARSRVAITKKEFVPDPAWPIWNAKWASRLWSSLFSEKPCDASRRHPGRAAAEA
jgi:transposase-like protein